MASAAVRYNVHVHIKKTLSVGVGPNQRISHRAVRISLEKQLDPIASRGGPYQYF